VKFVALLVAGLILATAGCDTDRTYNTSTTNNKILGPHGHGQRPDTTGTDSTEDNQ
jgi:hypothetical protein